MAETYAYLYYGYQYYSKGDILTERPISYLGTRVGEAQLFP